MARHTEAEYGELWGKAWRNLGAAGNPKTHFEHLMEKMREGHRKHHTEKHVFECWDGLEDFRYSAVYFDEVWIGIGTHDQIYKLERGAENEKESAVLTDQILKAAKVSYLPRRRIFSQTMATKHSYFPRLSDAQLAADVDLIIVGKPPQRYNQYADEIEEEFGFVPSELYRFGRIDVLEQFLKKHNPKSGRFIFHKMPIRDEYEEQAVENMSKEKEALLLPKPKIFIP